MSSQNIAWQNAGNSRINILAKEWKGSPLNHFSKDVHTLMASDSGLQKSSVVEGTLASAFCLEKDQFSIRLAVERWVD